MKLSISKNDLLTPLQRIIGVVERKQALPILANVLLQIQDGELFLTATDLEIELVSRQVFPQDITISTTLPARKLIDICRALPDDAQIELCAEQNKMLLQSGRSRFVLATLCADDFPKVEVDKQDVVSFEVDASVFKKLLQRTYFAMAQQDVRHYLNGLLLEIKAGNMTAVATDGHRLSLDKIVLNQDVSGGSLVFPRKGVVELIRLLSDEIGNITLRLFSNTLEVRAAQFKFISKLLDTRYPDYERVLPKNGNKVVTLDRLQLKAALQRTTVLCNEKFNAITFEFKKNLLRIFTSNPELEEAEEVIAIEYDDEPINLTFNFAYFLDILNTLESDLIRLTAYDENSSILIESGVESDNALFVIMPMKL